MTDSIGMAHVSSVMLGSKAVRVGITRSLKAWALKFQCHFYHSLLAKARHRAIHIQVVGNTVYLLMGGGTGSCVKEVVDTGGHDSLGAILNSQPHRGRTNC